MLKVSRLRLGFAAAQRGSICGKLRMKLGHKIIYDGYNQSRWVMDNSAIPDGNYDDLRWEINPNIKYILIIEKDAAFDQLRHSSFCEKNCILITGQGYPPVLCRKIIHNLHGNRPKMPIFGFVDCDAHGLDIFISYQQGTINAPESYLYAIPNLLYLGVEWQDVETYKIKKRSILKPNKKDCDKLRTLDPFLKRKQSTYFDKYPEKKQSVEYKVFRRIMEQLNIQKRKKKKVEIECLNGIGLGDTYLPKKIEEMLTYYYGYFYYLQLQQRSKPNTQNKLILPRSFSQNDMRSSNRNNQQFQRQTISSSSFSQGTGRFHQIPLILNNNQSNGNGAFSFTPNLSNNYQGNNRNINHGPFLNHSPFESQYVGSQTSNNSQFTFNNNYNHNNTNNNFHFGQNSAFSFSPSNNQIPFQHQSQNELNNNINMNDINNFSQPNIEEPETQKAGSEYLLDEDRDSQIIDLTQ